MKVKMKLSRLLNSLPAETREALETDLQGFSIQPDAAEIKRLSVIAEIKSLAEGERAVERYISTRDVDRDNEVLDPKGAILTQFKLAPQVLWAHDYATPPIGKAEWVKADDYGLLSKTVYATTERAEEVWQLIKGGFLATASVGFIPLKRVWSGDSDWVATVNDYNAKWSTDLEKAGCRVITTKWILVEYSDVPVPANPHALITAIAKGMSVSDALQDQLGLDALEAAEATEDKDAGGDDVDAKAGTEPEALIELSEPASEEADTIPLSPEIILLGHAHPALPQVNEVVSQTLAPILLSKKQDLMPILLSNGKSSMPVLLRAGIRPLAREEEAAKAVADALDQLRGKV